MGLFFNKKKANMIKTPFGTVEKFTGENNLPDNLQSLRAMAYYYNYREKNREFTYYIDKKIISLDKERKHYDSLYRMAMYYFDGFMVPRDNKIASKYFNEWMDVAFLEGINLSSVLSSLKQYFYYGFRDYEHLIDLAKKRIEQDIKNNSEPVGMCIYQNIVELWQHSKINDILNLWPKNAVNYFEFLNDNFDVPAAEFLQNLVLNKPDLTTFKSRDPAYIETEKAASNGNVLALDYLLDNWLRTYEQSDSNEQKAEYQRYKAEYDRIIAEYKKLQVNYDFDRDLAVKKQLDETLLKYADFYKGTCESLPENYPFSKKNSSIYYKLNKLIQSYNTTFKAVKHNKWPDIKNRQMLSDLCNYFIDKKYPLGMYYAMLCRSNIFTIDIDSTLQKVYSRLLEMNYPPALKLSENITDDTRKLILDLRINDNLLKEEAAKEYAFAFEKLEDNKWSSAVSHLLTAIDYGQTVTEWDKACILKPYLLELMDIYNNKFKNVDIVDITSPLYSVANKFNEPFACFIYAVILNNHYRDFTAAKRYCNKAIENIDHSLATNKNELLTHISDLLEVINSNLD